MRLEDQAEFTQLLVTAMAVYDRKITAQIAEMYFSALGRFTLAQVREGLNRHLQDSDSGKFFPKPADVIGQIQAVLADDGRPGKDEAWSIALCSLDELDTVLLTEEILAALAVAKPLLELRDKVAARMAFIESYERQLAIARREARRVKWIVSLGDDKGRRILAIDEAVRSGRLTHEQAAPHVLRISQETQAISKEGSAIAGLLAGPPSDGRLSVEDMRERLAGLREIVTGSQDRKWEASHAEALAVRKDLEDRKKSLDDAISEFEAAAAAGE